MVFLLLIIPTSSQMRLRLTSLELSSLSKREYRSGASKTVFIFTNVYLGMLMASFVCYLFAGMSPFDAINHAMSVTATGGFSTKNLSIGAFDSVPIDIITMVFMLLSSIHFGMTYIAIATRSLKPFRNEIFKLYLGILVIVSAVATVSLKANGIEGSWGSAALSGSFHVLSYASTSGFGIADTGAWPVVPSALLVFVGIVCGMAGSTTGGIKSDRALLLMRQIKNQLRRVLHPASVNEVRVNGRIIRQEDLSPHILYIAMYSVLVILSILVCLLFRADSMHAIVATFTSLGNVGPAVGDLGTASSFVAEPAGAKLMYTLDMFLGRVEIYPVLAVVMMVFNRKNK